MAERSATLRVGKASGGLLMLSVAMAAGIFAFDLSLPLDIAGGVPYVALVLIGLWLPWRHSLLVLAAIGSALTFIGFLFPAEVEFPWAGMLNRALALLAIWAVAVLAFERKKSEAALNASRQLLRTVIDAVPAAINAKDTEGRYVFMNAYQAEALGVDTEGVIGRTPADIAGSAYAASLRAGDAQVIYGGHGQINEEFNFTPSGGEPQTWLMTRAPVFDGAGEVGQVVTVALDVTEQKKTEERARQHQADLAHALRVSTMGEMVATFAHEINQPLAAVVNYARGAMRRLRAGSVAPDELVEVFEQLSGQAERASEIVRRASRFVRTSDLTRVSTDINRLVNRVASLTQADARGKGVAIAFDLAEKLPSVRVDTLQVEQVVLNLMRNGIEAMADARSPDPTLTIRTAMAGDAALEVAISDRGPGIPDDVADKILEPYFTTKPEGMGMGLSISRTLVEAYGGRLWVTRNDGGGATFHFTLPITEENQEDDDA